MCDVLKRLKYELDRKTLETIYLTFIRPKLEYGSQIWDDCTDRDKQSLDNVQLNAMRIVTGAKKGTSHNYLFEELPWPSLQERRTNTKLSQMHKLVFHTAPSYLTELVPDQVGARTRYPLRNSTNIRQIHARTEKYKNSLIPDSITKWNNLSDEAKSIHDLESFKEHITNTHTINPLFYHGIRKANIIHAQMRMRCSDLKAHLLSLHVTDDPICICQLGREDNFHFFLSCPLYNLQRQELVTIVNALSQCTLNVLLYGDDSLDYETNLIIVDAVHDYMIKSGRFN